MQITFQESLALGQEGLALDLGYKNAFDMEQEIAYWSQDFSAEIKAERDAEGAYERYCDYQAWMRDGWQPAHAF